MSDYEDTNEPPKKPFENLTDREKKVLKERFGIEIGDDLTLEELARQFDVTRERIREIERKALKKLHDRNDDPDDAA